MYIYSSWTGSKCSMYGYYLVTSVQPRLVRHRHTGMLVLTAPRRSLTWTGLLVAVVFVGVGLGAGLGIGAVGLFFERSRH